MTAVIEGYGPGGYYDQSPPHPLERVARREGESNLMSLLVGIEGGGDTTRESFCLAVAREDKSDVGPEALETHWAMADRYRMLLCRVVFKMLRFRYAERNGSHRYLRGAILDAYDVFRKDHAPTSEFRSKQFKMRKADYLEARKAALSEFVALQTEAGVRWMNAWFK
jgi:hypothetical protein